MADLMAIHSSEIDALVAGDFDQIAALKSRGQRAREHKAGLIELYGEHVISHGC
jgi:hypothetical protein